MKILHLSATDGGGGATRAAMRLHTYMRREGVDSRMLVARKTGDDPSVTGPKTQVGRAWAMARPAIGALIGRLDRARGGGTRSYNLLPTGLHRIINASDADIVHMHWVGGETISIGEIGRIRKPIVWTLRDMWPFSGALHYVDDLPGEESKRHAEAALLNLDRWTRARKQRALRGKSVHIVGLSRWIAECARSSPVFSGLPVLHIPNALDLEQFRPRDQRIARDVLRLPPEKRLVLFGAAGGSADPRKGAAYLWQALDMIADMLPQEAFDDIAAVMYGGWSIGGASPRMPVHCVGPIHDEATLALLHAAADVFVAPSLQENLPNTVIEASACGRPSVAFDVGGMPDVIVDGETGRLVPVKDARALAKALANLLVDNERRSAMGVAARQRAEACFAPTRVTRLYSDLYSRILEASG